MVASYGFFARSHVGPRRGEAHSTRAIGGVKGPTAAGTGSLPSPFAPAGLLEAPELEVDARTP